MNNNQFRKLVLDTPARKVSNEDGKSKNGAAGMGGLGGATPSLGSRMRSSIPMTPRNVQGYSSKNDFARQLAERNNPAAAGGQRKFRSTAAPKGSRLGKGYTDRTKGRDGDNEDSDKATRVKALEEMLKLGQMEEADFIKLREEILGDDLGERAGLVKGLDFTLLERARRGEVGVMDVIDGPKRPEVEEEAEAEDEQGDENVDDEFEELENTEVQAVVKERVEKKGEMANLSQLGSRKRNRDQILAELKAARLAAKEAAQPSLGGRFKKVGERRTETRMENDSKGRDVLITVDENGVEKRRVRKAPVVAEEKGSGLLEVDASKEVLGMEVPDIPKAEEEKKELDIFDDVGDDYDPLAGLDDDEPEGEKEDGELEEDTKQNHEKGAGSMPPPLLPTKARNYFVDTISKPEIDRSKPAALSDPSFLAALKKASSLKPIEAAKSEEEAAKEAKRKRMIQQDDRDEQDMDMGFGSSRFEDQEDGEGADGKRIKLSEWGSKDEGSGEDSKGGGKKERKRGGGGGGGKKGKRKGDKDSFKDVMGVIEGRKKAKEGGGK